MVEKFRLTNAKNVSTPMDPNMQFSIQQCPSTINQLLKMQGIPYSEVLGSVLWPTVVLRPDTAYVVGILSQFMQNPGPAHWEGLKRVINYMGHTKDLWLTFGGRKQEMFEGYCNADWASQTHRHLISGYSFHFGIGPISWSLKKQGIIALLSTEAEYIAETHAVKEGIWLKSFMNKIVGEKKGPLTVMADNQGAISLAKDNKFHAPTKHIDLHYHFVREAVEHKKIKMKYIPTVENVADIFMKVLLKPRFSEFVEKLGLAMKEAS